MTKEDYSDQVIDLTAAIEAAFPRFDDQGNVIAYVARKIWNGEQYARHNSVLGDRASADRVCDFLAAVESVRLAAKNLERQAAIPASGDRVNVAAMALHSLGSLFACGEDTRDAACIERGRKRLATELHDPVHGRLTDIADEMEAALRDYPVRQGRQDVHRQEMILALFNLFQTLRQGANGPAITFNEKGEATGAFPGFYRKIERALPERLHFADSARKAALGAALKGVLSEKVPA